MKLVSLKTRLSREEYLSALADHNRINEGIAFNEKLGKPAFSVSEKKNRIKVKCTYVGGNNKDNGFLVGSYFLGWIKERDGVTTLKGVAVTSPLFHLVLVGLTVLFIIKCMELGGFSVVPPVFLVMSLLLFKDEYKKQGLIKRFLYRAKLRTERSKK